VSVNDSVTRKAIDCVQNMKTAVELELILEEYGLFPVQCLANKKDGAWSVGGVRREPARRMAWIVSLDNLRQIGLLKVLLKMIWGGRRVQVISEKHSCLHRSLATWLP
jgi:hypothetical protein